MSTTASSYIRRSDSNGSRLDNAVMIEIAEHQFVNEVVARALGIARSTAVSKTEEPAAA